MITDWLQTTTIYIVLQSMCWPGRYTGMYMHVLRLLICKKKNLKMKGKRLFLPARIAHVTVQLKKAEHLYDLEHVVHTYRAVWLFNMKRIQILAHVHVLLTSCCWPWFCRIQYTPYRALPVWANWFTRHCPHLQIRRAPRFAIFTKAIHVVYMSFCYLGTVVAPAVGEKWRRRASFIIVSAYAVTSPLALQSVSNYGNSKPNSHCAV